MQKNKKNLLIGGVIVIGLVLVVGLAMALNQGSSSLQGFLSINKLPGVKLQNNSQTLYKGACQVRLATNPNLAKYDAANYGSGYAKVGKGQNFNSLNLDLVRAACTDTDYSNLLKGNNGQFCQNNPGAPFAQEVVLYNADGTPNTSGYSVKGQGPAFACSVNPAPGADAAAKQAAQKAAEAAAAKQAAIDAAAKQAAADKLAAEQAADKNDKQQMGSPSQSQNLVVKMSAQLFGGQKKPKTAGLDSVAGFDILSNNQAKVVIKSMTFNIRGNNSPEKNVTNYELWANGTKLTANVGVNFNDKTVTFDNILAPDIDYKSVMNFVVKATTAGVLNASITVSVPDGKAPAMTVSVPAGKAPAMTVFDGSVSYWLEVKSIALDWVSNVTNTKTPYTANFSPAVAGQVSTYLK